MSKAFRKLSALAAPLVEDNIDTDIIFPARFLLLMDRDGLGKHGFHDRRYDADGRERPEFSLNRIPYNTAQILVTGSNFGCGSSREQAVWALAGMGISCVIAPSFGEIFHGNCFRNGVLPVTLPQGDVLELAELARHGVPFEVDLEQGHVRAGNHVLPFAIDPRRRLALLNGWDDTELVLNADGDAITAFEARQKILQPWLHD